MRHITALFRQITAPFRPMPSPFRHGPAITLNIVLMRLARGHEAIARTMRPCRGFLSLALYLGFLFVS
jgi:hypothetical protein